MEVASSLTSQPQDLTFDGYYLTMGYFLDGSTHLNYNSKYAKFGAPTKTDGVWEVYSRYSTLDLQDNNDGSAADVYMIGANDYFNYNWHAQAQYYHVETNGYDSLDKITPDGNGVAIRLSYRF